MADATAADPRLKATGAPSHAFWLTQGREDAIGGFRRPPGARWTAGVPPEPLFRNLNSEAFGGHLVLLGGCLGQPRRQNLIFATLQF